MRINSINFRENLPDVPNNIDGAPDVESFSGNQTPPRSHEHDRMKLVMEDIVVTGTRIKPVDFSIQVGSFAGVQSRTLSYDMSGLASDPRFIAVVDLVSAAKLVSKTLSYMSSTLEALLALPGVELALGRDYGRLQKLADTLSVTGRLLEYGTLSVADAREMTRSAFEVAFSELGGFGTGILAGFLVTSASASLPPPHRAFAGVGAVALGVFLDQVLDSAAPDLSGKLAGLVTDGIFNGLEALASVMSTMIDGFNHSFNPVTREPLNFGGFDGLSDDIGNLTPNSAGYFDDDLINPAAIVNYDFTYADRVEVYQDWTWRGDYRNPDFDYPPTVPGHMVPEVNQQSSQPVQQEFEHQNLLQDSFFLV